MAVNQVRAIEQIICQGLQSIFDHLLLSMVSEIIETKGHLLLPCHSSLESR
jgi:hypothetical protein